MYLCPRFTVLILECLILNGHTNKSTDNANSRVSLQMKNSLPKPTCSKVVTVASSFHSHSSCCKSKTVNPAYAKLVGEDEEVHKT